MIEMESPSMGSKPQSQGNAFHQESSRQELLFGSRAMRCSIHAIVLIVIISSLTVGCSLLRPDANRLPEYEKAKRDITTPDWMRPEGARAEKRRLGATPGFLRNVPVIGDPIAHPEEAKALFQEADAIFAQAKDTESLEERKELFMKAAKAFGKAGKKWPSSYLQQDALAMEAESYFFAEAYNRAEDRYATLLREYPKSRYQDLVDQRRMEIALYWLKYNEADPQPYFYVNLTDEKRPWNDTLGHGRRVLDDMRLENPTGKYSDDGTMILANEAFQNGDFERAADLYADLRTVYHDSPHQFDAHFLGLKAIMSTYVGPEYTDGPLDEGEQLIKRMVRQFPKQAKEQEEYLKNAYAEIRYRRAEKLWVRAKFWSNTQEHAAARRFLDRILLEYAETPFAEKAAEEKNRIAELPDQTPQQFQWLANLFPEHDPVKPLLKKAQQQGEVDGAN